MGEIDDYRRRVEDLRPGYTALPRVGRGSPGPPDERTGERWDRGNVLGHVAEMLPYWVAQGRLVVEGGSTEMGRDELGFVQRREGIEVLAGEGDEQLLRRVDAGLEGLLGLLGQLRDGDLDRKLTFHAPNAAPREVDLRFAVEDLMIGHAEEHLEQVRALR